MSPRRGDLGGGRGGDSSAPVQPDVRILDSINVEGFSTSLTRIMLAEGAPATLSGLNRVDSLGYILEGIRVRH